MNAVRGVLTSFRSVQALEGLGLAGTSGLEHLCTSGQHTARCFQTLANSGQISKLQGAVITARLQVPVSARAATVTRQSVQHHVACHQPRRSLHHRAWSLIQQHSYRTQPSSKSMWQRDYYSSPYGRSYNSMWDGEKVLYGLIAANCAGFFLWQSSPGLMSKQATVSITSIREGRIYTLLTSAFSHASLNHLFANMFTFYFFGRQISQTFGGKKVCLCVN